MAPTALAPNSRCTLLRGAQTGANPPRFLGLPHPYCWASSAFPPDHITQTNEQRYKYMAQGIKHSHILLRLTCQLPAYTNLPNAIHGTSFRRARTCPGFSPEMNCCVISGLNRHPTVRGPGREGAVERGNEHSDYPIIRDRKLLTLPNYTTAVTLHLCQLRGRRF